MIRLAFALAALTLGCATSPTPEGLPWIRPEALKPGDTIALFPPSRTVEGRDLSGAIASMESWGYNVVLAENVESRRGNLAGTDEEKARVMMDLWRDPEIDMIWCIVGGYGTTRFIDLLDYDVIRDNPKILAGMSDVTGLHLAINSQAHMVTFLGPNATWPLIRPGLGPCEYAWTWTWRALDSASYYDANGNLLPEGYTFDYPTEPRDSTQRVTDQAPPKTVVPGVARGRLVGGNLSLVQSTVGTPFEIPAEGNILVFEDVREDPYRIDRMLSQLENAGILDKCAGVVLGTWSRCQPEDPDDSLSIDQVLFDYFAHRDYPVIANFPTGHVPEQATLPLGCLAELDATNVTLTLLENPVTLGD